jgi:probable HAF family extracellular repeat protein
MSRQIANVIPILLATICSLAGTVLSAPKYDIIDLDSLIAGIGSEALAINNRGEVVGWYSDGVYEHAFLWSNGILSELPGYSGPNSRATDINDSGLVVGYSWVTVPLVGIEYDAVIWRDGVASSIGDLGSGSALAQAINNAGDIIGQSFYTADHINSSSAFFKPAGGAMQGIGPVGRTYLQVEDINNLGQVTGTIINRDVTNSYRAFIYDVGSLINLGKPDLSLFSAATTINDSGHVAGWGTFLYGSTPLTRAMLYRDGAWIDFYGGAPSVCYALNNKGDIVGTHSSNPPQAFLWKNSQFQVLSSLIPPTSGWTRIDIPHDINDSGQIVGMGIRNGEGHAFLMSPHKYKLKIRDAYGDTLPGKTVTITRVNTNKPLYTERVVGDFVIDPAGVVEFQSDSISSGERFKVTLDVAEVPAIKHTDITTNKFHVFLDNVVFDSLGLPKFDTLAFTSDTQEVFIDHTTFVYDFVVSIEWDVELTLIADIENSFRSMANYMYDVTDGQARIGNIYIYDNEQNWSKADIHLWASNQVWPHVAVIGGIDGSGASGYPVEMPRKWFGSKSGTRNGTWTEWPLQMNVSLVYKTLLHELGHYAWSMKDEYKFDSGVVRCPDRQAYVVPYGFMDCQYDNCGDYSSELSSASAYTNAACRNNWHWNLYAKSCWSLFEDNMERAYSADSIDVVVNMPDERVLPTDRDFLAGPNDNLARLDYDVGALVKFPVSHVAPVRGNIIVGCWTTAGDSVPKASVKLHQSDGVKVDQGLTSDVGGIRVLNYVAGDTIKTSAPTFATGSKAAGGAIAKRWLFGIMDPSGQSNKYRPQHSLSSDGDSVAIIMNQVTGNYPMVFAPTYLNGNLSLTSWTPATFSQTPTIEHQPDDLAPSSLTVTSISNGYSALLPSPSVTGSLQFDGLDDSALAFFVPLSYVHNQYDSALYLIETKTSTGDAEIEIDSAVSGIPNVTIVSSMYPVVTDGLESLARQAGSAHGVAFGGVESITGAITILYSDSDLESQEQELFLRVHQFDDSAMQWVLIGGYVDTTHNEVRSGISEPGVYALFTTSVSTGSIDDPGPKTLPKRFELSQNYPNPFNPTTTIAFEVPAKGQVELSVFNILGQRVTTLVNQTLSAGRHTVEWNSTDSEGKAVASGVYFYRIKSGETTITKKMLLVK